MATVRLITRRFEFVLLALGETLYVYYSVLRLGKGLPRLLALLPVTLLSVLVPWRAPTAVERTLLSFLFLWLIMSKLFMVVWNRGPAADPSAMSSFWHFFSVVVLSVHLESNRDPRLSNSMVDKRGGKDASEAIASSESKEADASKVITSSKSTAAVAIDGVIHWKGGANTRKQVTGIQSDEKGSYLSWIVSLATAPTWQIVCLRAVFYFLVAAFLLRSILASNGVVSQYITNLMLGFFMYFVCLFLFEGAAALPAFALGLTVHPQFNMPFLADSIADFWGRRWNLLVNNLLRVSVYEPTLDFLTSRKKKINEKQKMKPSNSDRAISTAVVFLVSGLMHELIFVYTNHETKPSWEVTMFFVVNGAATIIEDFFVKPRDKHCRVPGLVRWAYTMSFVYLTACRFFFPPVLRTGMVDRSLAELETFINWSQRTLLMQKRASLVEPMPFGIFS